MCYLLRATQADAKLSGTALPPGPERLRARWAGAAALTLIGSVAVAAAFALAPATPELMSSKEIAAPTALNSRAAEKFTAVPAAAVVEQTSVPVDDGVPSALNDKKAAMGECHQGL